uniref:Uncharacterized protein n=1 Tax=Anguilla anguilla TaxID=7936 RepID=A0A0E9TF27_ANGAN
MKRVWHSDFIGFIGIGIMVNLGLGFLSPPFSSSVTVGVRFFVQIGNYCCSQRV